MIITQPEKNPDILHNTDEGPLSVLEGNVFDFRKLSYPVDIFSDDIQTDFARYPHYVVFYLNAQKGSQYLSQSRPGFEQVDTNNQARYSSSTIQSNRTHDGSAFVKNPANAFAGLASNTLRSNNVNIEDPELQRGIAKAVESIGLNRKTTRLKQAITLYIPDTLQFTYQNQFSEASLTQAFGNIGLGAQVATDILSDTSMSNILSSAAKGAAEFLTNKLNPEAGKFLFQALGYAVNPQIDVLYEQPTLRTFQFDFTFAPKSEDEARTVREIIKTFKVHAAPELVGSGRYFIPPSEFDIEFYYKGRRNNSLSRISTCVLENINIDYASNGFSTYHDGMPVITNMQLQFKELEVMTRQRIMEGF